jgi:hypothetical protein
LNVFIIPQCALRGPPISFSFWFDRPTTTRSLSSWIPFTLQGPSECSSRGSVCYWGFYFSPAFLPWF